jgi:signal transduction histidine kinase
VAGGVLALAVAAIVLQVLAGSHARPWWDTSLGVAAVLISLGLGVLIAVRRPGNRIALPLIANAAILTVLGAADGYALYAVLERPGALPGAEWAVLVTEKGWPLLFAPVVAIAYLFPDGRLPSRRWRPMALLVATTFATALVVTAFESEPFEAPYRAVENPLPAVAGIGWLWPVVLVGGLASLFGAVWAARVRFMRAEGQERLQLKWLAYSAFAIPTVLLLCLAFGLTGGDIDGDAFFVLVMFTMLAGVPASVGVAVLRYRLYEIDRLINRTLVYGVLTVLLAGIFAATTLLLGTAVGSGSSFATAGATLLVAVLFLPLRARIQDAVDRRFSRARYEGRRRIETFLSEVRAGREAPEAIEPMLREILRDPTLELRLWLPESEIYVDADGREPTDRPGDERLRTPIDRAGEPLGLLLHDPIDDERPAMLTEIVESAGLAIELVRLRVEVRRQLDEVEASRERIVAAGYAERTRLERDLHDGAQQRLVSVGLALRHAQHELGADANGASSVLDQAVAELGGANEELRELARGVRPAQLDGGLKPAFGELAARAPLPVKVQTGDERFPADLEAAAYFIASEAVTNAVKHAQATRLTLRADRAGNDLVVLVTDDGVGGADLARGSGLRGLADRVEAHGGTIEITSSPGEGTTIRAELPCES